MKYTITQAIKLIEAKFSGKQIRFIEYEDGSGVTFVFSFVGENKKQFIRLT